MKHACFSATLEWLVRALSSIGIDPIRQRRFILGFVPGFSFFSRSVAFLPLLLSALVIATTVL
jgi:hypothetical protein